MSSALRCLMVALSAFILFVGTLHAHEFLSHRHAGITLRTGDGGMVNLDMMLTLHLSGQRGILLQQRFDLDRDGRFSEVETMVAADELLGEAMGGLSIRCEQRVIKPIQTRQKMHRKDNQTVVLAVLLTYVATSECGNRIGIFSADGGQRKGLESIEMVVGALPPLTLQKNRRSRFILKPGKAKVIKWRFDGLRRPK